MIFLLRCLKMLVLKELLYMKNRESKVLHLRKYVMHQKVDIGGMFITSNGMLYISLIETIGYLYCLLLPIDYSHYKFLKLFLLKSKPNMKNNKKFKDYNNNLNQLLNKKKMEF